MSLYLAIIHFHELIILHATIMPFMCETNSQHNAIKSITIYIQQTTRQVYIGKMHLLITIE